MQKATTNSFHKIHTIRNNTCFISAFNKNWWFTLFWVRLSFFLGAVNVPLPTSGLLFFLFNLQCIYYLKTQINYWSLCVFIITSVLSLIIKEHHLKPPLCCWFEVPNMWFRCPPGVREVAPNAERIPLLNYNVAKIKVIFLWSWLPRSQWASLRTKPDNLCLFNWLLGCCGTARVWRGNGGSDWRGRVEL